MKRKLNDEIPVCAECLCASCYQGEFMCMGAKFADVVYKTRDELLKLRREHPDYLKSDEELGKEQ